MPISFNCPTCNKKLNVKDEMAGKVAKCPCGAKLKIPARRPQATQQPTAQPQTAQPQAAPQQPLQPLGQPAAQNPGAQPGGQPLQPLGHGAAPAPQQSAFDAANLQGLGSSGTGMAQSPGAELGGGPLGGGPGGDLLSGDPMSGGAMGSAPLTGGGQLQAQPAGQPVPMEAPQNLQNLNPDFQIQCIQCGQQFQMRPELFGQTITCNCGAPVRFDDPLGAGGSMINQDPLGLGAVMNAGSGQPLAYQSISQPNESKQQTRSREEEVLKMYIKDEEEFEKVTKPKGKSGGGGGGMNLIGKQGDGELSVGKVFSAIGALIGIFALGIIMIVNPDITGETEWGEGGVKGMILMLVWCRPTGIVLVSIGAVLVVLGCIMPKKILLILANDDDDDDDDE